MPLGHRQCQTKSAPRRCRHQFCKDFDAGEDMAGTQQWISGCLAVMALVRASESFVTFCMRKMSWKCVIGVLICHLDLSECDSQIFFSCRWEHCHCCYGHPALYNVMHKWGTGKGVEGGSGATALSMIYKWTTHIFISIVQAAHIGFAWRGFMYCSFSKNKNTFGVSMRSHGYCIYPIQLWRLNECACACAGIHVAIFRSILFLLPAQHMSTCPSKADKAGTFVELQRKEATDER